MKRYQDWAKREYSSSQRIVTLAVAGSLIVLIIPFLIVRASNSIDQALQLPDFYYGTINHIVGIIMIVVGAIFGIWSVEAQITLANGTPVPIIPTRKLIIVAPFSYCRNPMTLGTFLIYGGMCVWIGSFSAMAISILLGFLLILYIKLIEEQELEARFGTDYIEYKRSTPFILPRFIRRK